MGKSTQIQNGKVENFDWVQWKNDILLLGFNQEVSDEELLLITENLSPTVKTAAKQCVSDSNNDFQNEITNQRQLILESLTPSEALISSSEALTSVNWNKWKKKTIKQLDNASDKSNKETVDAIAKKGQSLPPQDQESFANFMAKAVLSGFAQIGKDIEGGIIEAADKIAEGFEDAEKAIGNWAEGAAKSVGHFFSSIF